MLAAPLYSVIKDKSKFVWGQKEQRSFEAVKKEIQKRQNLYFSDQNLPFVLKCDASNTGVGVVL